MIPHVFLAVFCVLGYSPVLDCSSYSVKCEPAQDEPSHVNWIFQAKHRALNHVKVSLIVFICDICTKSELHACLEKYSIGLIYAVLCYFTVQLSRIHQYSSPLPNKKCKTVRLPPLHIPPWSVFVEFTCVWVEIHPYSSKRQMRARVIGIPVM